MMRNQLGRRNLQPEALSYFRGKLHQASKQKFSNSSGSNQYSPQNEVKSQNDTQLNNTDSDQYNEVDCHNVSQPKSDQKETAFTLSKNLNVSPRTIYRDSQYAKAVDAIASVMGEEIRPKILSKRTEKKLTKKKTLELAKLAKRKPEEVIEYFNPKPVEKSNPEKLKPFPFKVGEVVKIIPKSEPDLRGKGGYWAIITKVHLTCCDLQLWNGTVEFISAENLVSLELSSSECEQMKVLCDRLSNIREAADDPIVNHNLQFFGHLKHPKLTETQQKMLEYLENLHEDTCIDNSKTKEKLNDLNIADDFESTKNEPLTITNNPESINNKFGKIERNNSDLTNNESLVQP